jgi:hypothetical protein
MAKYANQNAVTVVRVSGKKQGDADHFGMDAQRTSTASQFARRSNIRTSAATP